MFSALSDQAPRVIRAVIEDPVLMLENLDTRNDSKSAATKISKMSELVSMHYTSHKGDMTKPVDRMAGLLGHIRSMRSPLENTLAIDMSIGVTQLEP